MRILMVTGEFPPLEGGVGAFTDRISQAIIDQGHQVDILTSCNGIATTPATEASGATVHRTIGSWSLLGLRRLHRWIRKLQPDVVNVQYEPAAYGMQAGVNFAPSILGRSGAFPWIVTFHDLLPPYLFPKAGPLRMWSVRWLAHRAAGTIATNQEDWAALQRMRGPSWPPLRLIPIGSNIHAHPLPRRNRQQWRAEFGLRPDDLLIGFFGFMNRTKGIETLLSALSYIVAQGYPAQLVFIGGKTGSSDITNVRYAEEIDRLISNLGLTNRILRTGYASSAEISAALRAIDVCAHPFCQGGSLRHGTLHAALAHGCAIVTTHVADELPFDIDMDLLPSLTPGGNVMLVPPEDSAALAEAIIKVTSDQALNQRLRSGATALARQFSWPSIASETIAFFESLL